MSERPDILVLGGGGRQGDAWMTGVVAGLEDAHGFELRRCDYFVGTSAGAILAAKLVSGRCLKRPNTGAAPPGAVAPVSGRSTLLSRGTNSILAIASPFAGVGVRFGRAPGEMLRRAALSMVPTSATGTLDFREAFPPDVVFFDGRLRVTAVDRASGKRVVFGAPGAPPATVAQALTASCSLPHFFAPAVVAGREYVDGAIWSTTNADVAPASRDAQVVILAPMASLHGPFHHRVRALARAALLLEASVLKLRGAHVRFITPDRQAAAALGNDLMATDDLHLTQAVGYGQGTSL